MRLGEISKQGDSENTWESYFPGDEAPEPGGVWDQLKDLGSTGLTVCVHVCMCAYEPARVQMWRLALHLAVFCNWPELPVLGCQLCPELTKTQVAEHTYEGIFPS